MNANLESDSSQRFGFKMKQLKMFRQKLTTSTELQTDNFASLSLGRGEQWGNVKEVKNARAKRSKLLISLLISQIN